MNVKQQDLVLVPYPFTNLKEEKVRPAVILSNESYNKQSKDCIALPLTSVINENPFSILISQNDMQDGNLIKQSSIRTDKIFSVQKNLIRMRIGSLKKSVFDKVRDELFRIIQ
ncbi:MAG: type II toxin-antitoxin system PemK/MazF family toxin [Nanoarchaeota archaeon]